MASPFKPRWKVVIELIAAAFGVFIGATLMTEGWDITPVFQITNWAALILGLVISMFSWVSFRDAWSDL